MSTLMDAARAAADRPTRAELLAEIERLRAALQEAQSMLAAGHPFGHIAACLARAIQASGIHQQPNENGEGEMV